MCNKQANYEIILRVAMFVCGFIFALVAQQLYYVDQQCESQIKKLQILQNEADRRLESELGTNR